MGLSVLSKFVDANKLGGWVRAGVGALLVMAIAKWPVLSTIMDQDTQIQLAVVSSSIVVGIWSHIAKNIAAGVNVGAVAKKVTPLLFAAIFVGMALGLPLAGCSTQVANNVIAATTTYDNAVQNFNAAAAAVNGSIALTSNTVGPYCAAAQTAGQNLAKLASGSTAATTALNTAAAALKQYCIALPTDIQGAVVALTQAAVSAKQAASGG